MKKEARKTYRPASGIYNGGLYCSGAVPSVFLSFNVSGHWTRYTIWELQLRFLCKCSVNRTIYQNPVVQVLSKLRSLSGGVCWSRQMMLEWTSGWARISSAKFFRWSGIRMASIGVSLWSKQGCHNLCFSMNVLNQESVVSVHFWELFPALDHCVR